MRRSIDPAALICLAFAILIVPLRILFSWLAASIVHELFHCLAVRLCGGRIDRITVHPGGATMDAHGLSKGGALIATAAGPLGALSLLLLRRFFPLTALIALLQSAYNLMPMQSLDGGRILSATLRISLRPESEERICHAADRLCRILIWLGAAVCTVWLHLGALPIVFAAFLTIRGKTPCKPAQFKVQ